MSNRFIFSIGILGVGLFVISSIIGGLLIENYSIWRQFISETYAIDTEYGVLLRVFGYIPSGVLLALFCFLGVRYFQPSKLVKTGFYGIGIFYGLATVAVAIFPCDSGCSRDFVNPSTSQIIHNLVGLLTYLLVPVFMIIVGIGLKKPPNPSKFSFLSIIYGVIAIVLVSILLSNPNSEYIGLFQRLVESVFLIWIISCSITIKNSK